MDDDEEWVEDNYSVSVPDWLEEARAALQPKASDDDNDDGKSNHNDNNQDGRGDDHSDDSNSNKAAGRVHKEMDAELEQWE